MLNHMGTEKQLSVGDDRLLDKLCAAVESKLQPYRRVELPMLCDEIGLPRAPDDKELSKREYIRSRLEKLSQDDQVRDVAVKFASRYPVGEDGNDATYEIEELLWEAREPDVSLRVRRELASTLDRVELFTDPDAFLDVLAKLFVLDPDGVLLWNERNSLPWRIRQHVIRNPEDWSVGQLFQEIGGAHVQQ